MTGAVPPPVGSDWKVWARQISDFVRRNLVKLQFRNGVDVATEDGIILWDEVNGYPVVSKDGSYRQIVLADGFASLDITSNVTASAANTAQALTFGVFAAENIALGTPASRIVVEEGGEYLVSFSAQVISNTASTVTFYFWIRKNGVDVLRSSVRTSIHTNGRTAPISRTVRVSLNDGEYIELMWAVSDTNGSLSAFAATAFAPATPAAIVNITRVRA